MFLCEKEVENIQTWKAQISTELSYLVSAGFGWGLFFTVAGFVLNAGLII